MTVAQVGTQREPDLTAVFPSHCHAIVLAGGSGTRLWPLSRAMFPKQLLAFSEELSLLQLTLQRLLLVFAPECIHVVTGEDHVFEVRNQARALEPRLERGVVAEPRGRNTLPAILLGLDGAWPQPVAGMQSEPPLVAVFPSDHHILAPERFADSVREAMTLGQHGWFVTFGIPPTSPETGYGYIERGDVLDACAGGSGRGYGVQRFVEKPDRETAEGYVRSGRHFWNSGMFVFPAVELLAAVEQQQPELFRWWNARATRPLLDGYADIPSLSVDYGIMEHATHTAMVEADFGWDDLGSWEALYRLARKDEQGCSVQGDVLALDCQDSLLISRWGKLAAIGVKDVVAVQTRDATLICARDQVQRVKDVVEQLKREKSSLAEVHLTVRRPWGSYTVLEDGADYKIKRISVSPGGRLSLQKHFHRAEHWVVVRGTAEVQLDDATHQLTERQWLTIPQGACHRLTNPGRIPLEIIEIQSGSYLEEDDIVRLEDIYGR